MSVKKLLMLVEVGNGMFDEKWKNFSERDHTIDKDTLLGKSRIST